MSFPWNRVVNLGGIVKGLGGVPLQIGGIANHVHMLVSLRQDIALSVCLREIKADSSKWVHATFPEASDFYWQSGYGAFTVSHSQLDSVAFTYQDEFRLMLVKHGIAFNERYLWE